MSLRLDKNSGKTMKTLMYDAVAVFSQDRDNVVLEDVSSTQNHEEHPIIPERMKPKENVSSAIPV